jgi:hypothetical protein
MPPLAGVHDLEYRLGRPFREDELPRVKAVLEDASALVRDVAYRDWIDPTSGTLTGVPNSVRAVTLKIAERAIRNPGGFSAESAGDYSFQRNGAADGVYLSDREEQIIRRAIGKTGLWTQPVERGDMHAMNTIWAEDNYGTELFPLDTYYGDCR